MRLQTKNYLLECLKEKQTDIEQRKLDRVKALEDDLTEDELELQLIQGVILEIEGTPTQTIDPTPEVAEIVEPLLEEPVDEESEEEDDEDPDDDEEEEEE